MSDPTAVARRNTRPLVIGQSVSQFGDYLALFFALPVFVRDLTGSAGALLILGPLWRVRAAAAAYEICAGTR